MTEQPTALRLADALDRYNAGVCSQAIYEDYSKAAAELRRLHQHEVALREWLDKTSWMQETARPGELGMHRADAMRARMLKAEAQRDALLTLVEKIRHCDMLDAAKDGTFWKREIDATIKAVEEGK